MKIRLPFTLKKALLIALFATVSCFSSAMATTVTQDGTTLTVSGTGEADLPAWGSNNTIVFDDSTDASTIVEYAANLTNIKELNINSNGATLQTTEGNTGSHFITAHADGMTINANGNFTLDMANGPATGSNQYNRNFSVGSSSATFNIASGKTFTLIGDMVGDAGGSFNIAGGGTLTYTHNDVDDDGHNQHNTGTAFNISGSTTLDLSTNDASKMNILLLQGEVSLNQGSIHLMTGDVTMANDLSITASALISGASTLTLTGEISMARSSFLDFGDSMVDLSAITLDLGDLEVGISYDLFKTNSTFTGWSDSNEAAFTVTGLDADDMTWSYNADAGVYSVTLNAAAPETLTWQGGNGTLAADSTGWNDGKTFANGDTIILDGAAGTMTVDGAGVELAGLIVNGDSDYTLSGGSITMTGTADTAVSLTKNGLGILTLATDNAISNVTKNINAGTLHVASQDALGTGAVQISNNATLSIAGAADAASGYIVDTGVATTYNRDSQGYTVSVGTNVTLKDNVNLRMGGSETTITGGGTYEIWGFTMSHTNSATQLTVDANTTLVIKGDVMSHNGGAGSFMLGNWGKSNTLNIYGTVDSTAGISMRDGSTQTIKIYDQGELILRRGLAAVGNGSNKSINIDVQGGATLTLFDTSNNKTSNDNTTGTAFIATVNMASGSTLQAGEAGTTTVSDALNFGTTGTYTFAVAADKTLNYAQDLSVGTLKMKGDGALVLNSLTLNPVTRASSSLAITANDGGTITVQNAVEGEDAVLTANSITGASLTGVTVAGSGSTLITGSSFTNSSLTGVIIGQDVTLGSGVSLIDSTIDGVTVTGTSLGVINSEGGAHADSLILTIDVSSLMTTKATGQLTLDLDLSADQLLAYTTALETEGALIGFALTNADSLSDIMEAGSDYYGNVSILVNGMHRHTVLGITTVDGGSDVLLYIPEPSTATLSLLALTSLLARRRRKAV